MGILRALHEAGREIPSDVSVVGFDDVPEAEFQMVPLTTVAVNAESAAQRILAELLGMIEGREPAAQTITVPSTELIIRRSSGPVLRDHRRTKFVTEASSFSVPQPD
jgi:DNA-binding LacI/PurR family transcriptional regulator